MSTTRPARAVRYILIPTVLLALAVIISWQLLPGGSAARGLPARPGARAVIAGRIVAVSVARRGGYVEVATPLPSEGVAISHVSILRLGPESMIALDRRLPRVPLLVLTAFAGDAAAEGPSYLATPGASVEALVERRGDRLYALSVRPVATVASVAAPPAWLRADAGDMLRIDATAGMWRAAAGTTTVEVRFDVPGEPGRTWYAVDAQVSGSATMTTQTLRRKRVRVQRPYDEFDRTWSDVEDASATVVLARQENGLRVVSLEATPRIGPTPDDLGVDEDAAASPIIGLSPGSP